MQTEHKVIIIGLLATVVIIGGLAWLSNSKSEEERIRLSEPLLGEEIVEGTPNHVPEGTVVEHKSNPPAGGPHFARTQPAGIYDEPRPDGSLIHSMEHGAVILWHKSDLPQEEVEKLKEIYRSVPVSKKIMVSRENMDTPIALTSWERLLGLETIDETKIIEFMVTNYDRGPEKAPI